MQERSARRQAEGLAAVAVVGVVVATRPGGGRLGVLLAGFAIAGGLVEIAVMAVARGRTRRAVDDLIGAGIVIALRGDVQALVDDRLRELDAPRSRRRTAAALRRALADAGRTRSSNPLVLAQRSIVLPRGTAHALLTERDLVLRIAQTLCDRPANPRAVLTIRNLLYQPPTGACSDDDECRHAQRDLRRTAELLRLGDPDPPSRSVSDGAQPY